MVNSMKKVTSAGKSCPGEEHRYSVEPGEEYTDINVEEVQDTGTVEMHYEQVHMCHCTCSLLRNHHEVCICSFLCRQRLRFLTFMQAHCACPVLISQHG